MGDASPTTAERHGIAVLRLLPLDAHAMGISAVTNVLAAGMTMLRAWRFRAAKHLAIAVLSVAFAAAVVPACGAEEVGVANKVVNEVYGNSVLKRMKSGELLVFNQKIRTGVESAADLIFLDDSELVIGERAEVTIDEFVYDPDTNVAKGAVNIAKGVLRFASASAKLDVSLKTPTATIGIRGTVFDVLASSRSTEIAVLEGAVEVVSRFGTEIVNQGQVLSVSDTGGASLSTRALDEMRAAVARMFATLGPVDGAGRAVHVGLATGRGEQHHDRKRHRFGRFDPGRKWQGSRKSSFSGSRLRPRGDRDATRSCSAPRRARQAARPPRVLRWPDVPQRGARLHRRDRRSDEYRHRWLGHDHPR